MGAAAAAPLDALMAAVDDDDEVIRRPRRRKRRKNLDLRTMLRKEKLTKRAPSRQMGFYINARTTLSSLIRQMPGGTTPLSKLLRK